MYIYHWGPAHTLKIWFVLSRVLVVAKRPTETCMIGWCKHQPPMKYRGRIQIESVQAPGIHLEIAIVFQAECRCRKFSSWKLKARDIFSLDILLPKSWSIYMQSLFFVKPITVKIKLFWPCYITTSSVREWILMWRRGTRKPPPLNNGSRTLERLSRWPSVPVTAGHPLLSESRATSWKKKIETGYNFIMKCNTFHMHG